MRHACAAPDARCVTIPVTTVCPVCGRSFTPDGRRKFCRDACRAIAYRRRRAAARPMADVPAATSRVSRTVYECGGCDVRAVGRQRCTECDIFMRRIGPGGACPHCDEPVAVAELIGPMVTP